MAYTITDYWYTLKPNHAAAMIGEDHQGNWVRTQSAEAAVKQVAEWHKNHKKPVCLWHEGESSAISKSFKAFVVWFKGTHKLPVQIKQWEPKSIKYTKEEKLIMDLMSGDAMQMEDHLGLGMVYMDALLANTNWRGAGDERYTADDILRLVDQGKHAKQYRKLLSQPITKAVLKEWFQLREEAFENKSSRLYPIMNAPQWKREDWLAGLLKAQSGIFLVGESHIGSMRERGLIKK